MQCIRQDLHTRAWKRAKEIILQKPDKLDYMTIKLYRMISLLKCLCKVCQEVMSDMLAEWYKVNNVLHECQMRYRKHTSVIDAVARIFIRYNKHEWKER